MQNAARQKYILNFLLFFCLSLFLSPIAYLYSEVSRSSLLCYCTICLSYLFGISKNFSRHRQQYPSILSTSAGNNEFFFSRGVQFVQMKSELPLDDCRRVTWVTLLLHYGLIDFPVRKSSSVYDNLLHPWMNDQVEREKNVASYIDGTINRFTTYMKTCRINWNK